MEMARISTTDKTRQACQTHLILKPCLAIADLLFQAFQSHQPLSVLAVLPRQLPSDQEVTKITEALQHLPLVHHKNLHEFRRQSFCKNCSREFVRVHVRTHPVLESEPGKIKTRGEVILDSDPTVLSELAAVKSQPHGTRNFPHPALHVVGQQDLARLHELCQELYDMCNYRHQSNDAFARCFNNLVCYGQSVKNANLIVYKKLKRKISA